MAREPGAAASSGSVVTVHPAATDAGVTMLSAGGSAVDAAVAAGFALCVVEPAECGLGAYGGFLTYSPPSGAPLCLDFNSWVPDRVDDSAFGLPGVEDIVDGGRAVAPPMAVPGLVAAQERYGRLPLSDVIRPAVRLAREGFAVSTGMARTCVERWTRTGGGTSELARIFFPGGKPPAAGSTLVQPELAETLETVAARGAAAFRDGPLVEAICDAAAADGGSLRPSDFLRSGVSVGQAEPVGFKSSTLYGPPRETSGSGVLFSAIAALEPERLGANRGDSYVHELRRALVLAWRSRTAAAQAAARSNHTTSLCSSDAEGGLVALTFTHGIAFGAGIVPPGTGLVLNAGANLFVATPGGPVVMSNMSPIVLQQADGTRHALAASGGPRIPSILLTAVIDVEHYEWSLSAALRGPRLSVDPRDGELEAEPDLLATRETSGWSARQRGFSPAAGITRTVGGTSIAAVDPRLG